MYPVGERMALDDVGRNPCVICGDNVRVGERIIDFGMEVIHEECLIEVSRIELLKKCGLCVTIV